MSKVFETPAQLADYIFRITDNGGKTADRYTVAFTDGTYLGMSGAPSHPQGVSMSGEGLDPLHLDTTVEEGEAVDLALGDLPERLVDHILYRCNEGLEDFLAAVEARDPQHVVSDREVAKIHEGIHSSMGDGIYQGNEGFMIRLEGDAADDLGPYVTAAEAVRATVPDIHALSGPEYHSNVDVTRLTADPEVTKAVTDLEVKRSSEWDWERGAALRP